mgnify:CR=1 FL=1
MQWPDTAWIFPRLRRGRDELAPGRFCGAACPNSGGEQGFDAGVEGNLLAAHQEIQKLRLLFPPGELDFEAVCGAVLNVARYDAFKLNEAMLSGDKARLARMLDGLKSEGEAPPKILWVLTEEIRAVAKVRAGMALGEDLQQLYRNNRVWGDLRQRLVNEAARRIKSAALGQALRYAARIDRTVKGLARGDVWDELLQLCLRFAR